jgi:benzoyl-CoA reductase/2-hydroxyglutaryl-CoA dehydratase subunit BcrC/BadD/HgdB
MIGYLCKYTPVEVLESMGAQMQLMQPQVTDFNAADTMMHPNMCSYVKSVLEEMQDSEYEGLVVTTCCDSVRRLYDVLSASCPDKFIYVLDPSPEDK